MGGISELFGLTPSPKRIVTSRPIFQFSSSFIDDGSELKKPAPAYLPFSHRPAKPLDDDIDEDDEYSLIKPRPKPQFRLHLILHILNTIFTLVSISIYVTVIPLWNANFHHTRSIVSGDYTDGLVIAPLLISLAASTYLLLTEHVPFRLRLRVTNSRGSLKPKTLALLSLTILLTLGPTLTVSATNCLAFAWRSPARTKSGLIICNLANIFSRPCQPLLFQIGGLQIAGITTGGLAWCVWFAILGVAIRTWARERRERKHAARDRRRRRHTRRRGHGQEHRRKHRSRKNQENMPSEAETVVIEQNAQGYDDQHYTIHNMRHHRSHHETYAYGSSNWPSEHQPGKVRPKETFQTWLNGRYN